MKQLLFVPGTVLLALLALSPEALAQSDVTIPKSRLEELERKEKELDRLQKKPAPPAAQPSQQQLTTPGVTNTALPSNAAPPPAATRESPPLASLPSFQSGDTVDAIDLANYYKLDAKAADKRFKGQKMTVRGEIVSFEKPFMRRDYQLLLQSGDPKTFIQCDLYPPDKFSSVFTVNSGAELVGLQGATQVPMAKVGQTVLVTGKCRGYNDSAVKVYALDFSIVK